MKNQPITANPWTALRSFTPARIALGRAGSALPTGELLRFGLAHARARDAVHRALDAEKLIFELSSLNLSSQVVRSAAPDRATYLRRPDLGRRLSQNSFLNKNEKQLALVIADGLSALAVERHAVALVRALIALAPQRWAAAPAAIALQGRVALGDEIGARLGAQLVVVLIGERPGLSSPDSLGAYLTYAPRVGRTDAERNCVSNIRPGGLGYEPAARRIDWLAAAALARGLTGVALKDESAGVLPGRNG
ncbi:MAG: ethanolamine ammonia-lyase subunit EutC [Pseudomonadota bacterium]